MPTPQPPPPPPQWKGLGEIKIVKDPIAERLDEMADLSKAWERTREKGRTPRAVRLAMIHLAEEIAALATLDGKAI